MSDPGPTVQEVFDSVFQTLEESDVKNLKKILDMFVLNNQTKKHLEESFSHYQTDISSLKALEDEEKVSRRIYSYAWELIVLLASLHVQEFYVIDYSFLHNKREKDLLIGFNKKKYHVEITSKDDISRSKEEKDAMVKDTDSPARELDSKNIEDNSVFDYDVSNKFDIPETEEVLFIYQMKSGFLHFEEYIASIKTAAEEQGFKYILYNNLSSTKGRFVPEYKGKDVKAWHNFDNDDLFLNQLMPSIINVLNNLKESKGDAT